MKVGDKVRYVAGPNMITQYEPHLLTEIGTVTGARGEEEVRVSFPSGIYPDGILYYKSNLEVVKEEKVPKAEVGDKVLVKIVPYISESYTGLGRRTLPQIGTVIGHHLTPSAVLLKVRMPHYRLDENTTSWNLNEDDYDLLSIRKAEVGEEIVVTKVKGVNEQYNTNPGRRQLPLVGVRINHEYELGDEIRVKMPHFDTAIGETDWYIDASDYYVIEKGKSMDTYDETGEVEAYKKEVSKILSNYVKEIQETNDWCDSWVDSVLGRINAATGLDVKRKKKLLKVTLLLEEDSRGISRTLAGMSDVDFGRLRVEGKLKHEETSDESLS